MKQCRMRSKCIKQHRISTKTIAFLWAAVLLCSCFAAGGKRKTDYHKVNVLYKLPVVVDDSAEMIIDSTCIVYAGDWMLYELPYRKTEEVDNVLVLDTMLHNYFVHKKGAVHGLLLQALSDSSGTTLPVDSMLEKRVKKAFDIPWLFAKKNEAKSYIRQNGSELVQVLALDDEYFDSASLYFNKELMQQPYSLSGLADSLYQSRLYKADILLKQYKSANSAYLNNFRHLSLEFSVLPVTNAAALDRFFERIKKQLNK